MNGHLTGEYLFEYLHLSFSAESQEKIARIPSMYDHAR